MDQPHDRRSFLGWAINGLGAIFGVVIGVPIVGYLLDPRHRTGAASVFKLAEEVRLSDLSQPMPVQQGVIRDVRRDAWTLHPNDVIGRVWVVLQPGKTMPADAAARRALSSHDAQGNARNNAPIKVFTTICPHLGCSINLNADARSFTCPCHGASFERDGDRAHPHHNPAPRSMDELTWRADPDDPDGNRLLVKYENFLPSDAVKIPIA